MSFVIDGFSWNIPCTIERTAKITASEISGMLLNKQYFNDVLGTWMRYTISIAIPRGWESDYDSIYEILSSPVDAHSFTLPYNSSEINITGRVDVVSDTWVRLPNNKQTWRKTTFDVIANHPSKTMSLTEVITRGMTPLPEAPGAQAGDLYEYTNYGWIQRFYVNADEVRY